MNALAAAVLSFAVGASPRAGLERPRTAPELVDVATAVPDAVVDLRYATDRNLVGRALYPQGARCLVLAPVAARLVRVAARLRADGLRLRLYDCYRPPSAQRELWQRMPTRGLVADPAKGSNHGRGAAIDAGLAALDGADPEMPTDFDAFGPRARASARAGISDAACRNRDHLRAAMESEGFRVNRLEWWHFDAPEARGAPVLDVPLAP